jgi:hypothetical protein
MMKTMAQNAKEPTPPQAGGVGSHLHHGTTTLANLSAATLCLVAALIHLWVAPEHFSHWWLYGAFFVGCSFSQGLLAILILRLDLSAASSTTTASGLLLRRVVGVCGIMGNLSIVALYVIVYTWGLPFSQTWVVFDPSAAHLQNAEALGISATASEVGVVILLAMMLDGAWRRWTVNALVLAGLALWGARLLGYLP